MAPVIAPEERETTTETRTPQHLDNAGRRVAFVAILVLVIFALALVLGLAHHRAVDAELQADARDHARTPVSILHPQSSGSQLNVTFPANIQAYAETAIYARTNGYIKKWMVDIGGRVERGQLLAEIETPELDRQLQQAEAAQAQAEADLELARSTAARYQDVLKTDGVSKQEYDQAVSALRGDEARLRAAKANVAQLKDLVSFERVTAPFSGTITARYIDIGTLIASGTNTMLFRLADISTLRVYANVPETESKDVRVGMSVDVEALGSLGKKFGGKVVRTAGAIDPVSRTLLTEVRVPNPGLELVPGQYGEVTFHLHSAKPVLILPSSALLFRAQGTQVALVQRDSTVKVQSIQLGRDLGSSVEVVQGLTADDSVIDNPSDSISDGALVSIQQPQTK